MLVGPSTVKQGHTYAVTDNTSSSLTITTTTVDDASGIPANTQITIIPNWTPNTLFPAASANVSFTPTSSPPTYKTLIQVPNYSGAGINLSYATTYYFNQSNNRWQIVNDNTNADHGDDQFLPDGYLVIENANGAPTLPLINLGAVLSKQVTTPLLTSAGGQQDNPVGMIRPLGIALNATGLGPANGSFVANDQLLVFDNTQIAFNKSPAATYYYDTTVGNSGGWRLTGDSRPNDRGSDIIPMGSGFIVRKAQTGAGQPAFWTNSFPVQAVSAVSRKLHGAAGTFDLTLPINLQFNSSAGIESRVAGSTPAGAGTDHQIIMNFSTPVTFSSVAVTSGVATVNASSNNSTTVTLNLSGVSNAQKTTITLLGATDGNNTNDVAVQMGFLIGDVNASGLVDSGDVFLVRQQTSQTANASNFREDVNATGLIDSGDVFVTRQHTATSLP